MASAVHGGADEDLLQWLMDRGAHMQPPEGHTGLYRDPLISIRRIDKEYRYKMVQWFLKHGGLVNDRIGNRTVHVACCDIDVKTIKVLLDYGIQLDESEETTETYLQILGHSFYGNRDDDGPSHWQDHIEATRLLLGAGAKMFYSMRPESGGQQRLLPRIVIVEHFQVFLDHGIQADETIQWDSRGPGFEHLRYQGFRGGTILHYAVERHSLAFVTQALDAGASPHAKNWLGHTAWELAKGLHGSVECICGFMTQLGDTAVNTDKERGVKRALEE